MIKLKGKLTISRVTGGKEDYIRIQIEDENSLLNIVEVEVLPIHFGNAVTGLSYQPCAIEFNDSGNVGLIREHKTEIIEFPGLDDALLSGNQKKLIEDVISKEYNKDGWVGRCDDARNYHNKVWKNTYKVTFVRYSKPKG